MRTTITEQDIEDISAAYSEGKWNTEAELRAYCQKSLNVDPDVAEKALQQFALTGIIHAD